MSVNTEIIEKKSFEERFHTCFGKMLVCKSSSNTKFFAEQSLPSFIRDWLVMRFSDSDGAVDEEKLYAYIKKTIPNKEQWHNILVAMLFHNESARFLAKVKIDFDMKKKQALFSLPAFQVPERKGGAVVDWSVIERHRDELLSSADVWGIVTIRCESDGEGKNNVFKLDGVVAAIIYLDEFSGIGICGTKELVQLQFVVLNWRVTNHILQFF